MALQSFASKLAGWTIGGLQWFADAIDPEAVAAHDDPHHRRGPMLWTPRGSSERQRYRLLVRTARRWTASIRPPGDEVGVEVYPGVRISMSRETHGGLALGAPGAGKTQILAPVLQQAIVRGDMVIVWDAKLELTPWLLSEWPDLVCLLAPWDTRTAVWSLSADIRTRLDCAAAAQSWIPPSPAERQPYFSNAARSVLEAILLHLAASGRPWSWDNVWDALATGREAAAAWLATTREGQAAAEAIGGKAQKASAEDVWSTLAVALAPLRDVAQGWRGAAGLSLRAVAHGHFPSTVVVLPCPATFRTLAIPVARLAIEMIAREVLSAPEDPRRRLWFVLDEFASLGRMDAVADVLVRGRSKGARVWASLQDLGQLRAAYGRDLAQSIVNAFSTLFVVRVADPELSESAARALGRRQVEERLATRSEHRSEHGGETVGEHISIREEYVVLPSQIQSFHPLEGILRVAGWPLLHLRWPYRGMPPGAPAVDPDTWATGSVTLTPVQPRASETGGGNAVVRPHRGRERERGR